MRSTRLQLLVTLVAVLVAAIVFADRGPPPTIDTRSAASSLDIRQLRRCFAWGMIQPGSGAWSFLVSRAEQRDVAELLAGEIASWSDRTLERHYRSTFGAVSHPIGDWDQEAFLCDIARRGGRRWTDFIENEIERAEAQAAANNERWVYRSLSLLTTFRRLQHKPDPMAVVVENVDSAHVLDDYPVLKVRLVNRDVDGREFSFLDGGDYRTGRRTRFSLEVTDPDGHVLPVRLRFCGPRGGLGNITLLKPGEFVDYLVPMADYVSVPRPGVYQVRVLFARGHIADAGHTVGHIVYRSDPLTVEFAAAPVVDGKVVIDGNRVVRLEASGRERWAVDVGRHVSNNRPPDWVAHRGMIIVAPWPAVVALDDKTGDVLWRSPGPGDRLMASRDLLLALDCSIDPPEGRWLMARDVNNGREVWKVRLPDKGDPDAIRDVGDLFLIASGRLSGGSSSHLVDRWGEVRLKLDEYVFAAADLGSEVLLVSATRVARVFAGPELERWRLPVPERWASPWPFASAEIVPLGSDEAIVYFFGPISDSGVEVWRLDTVHGEVRWQADCPGLGVDHSKYAQEVSVGVTQTTVVVSSKGSAGNWCEELSLEDGRRLRRR